MARMKIKPVLSGIKEYDRALKRERAKERMVTLGALKLCADCPEIGC